VFGRDRWGSDLSFWTIAETERRLIGIADREIVRFDILRLHLELYCR
jgi:hypothetical protein